MSRWTIPATRTESYYVEVEAQDQHEAIALAREAVDWKGSLDALFDGSVYVEHVWVYYDSGNDELHEDEIERQKGDTGDE